MITESRGIWRATARLATHDESADGYVTLSRNGADVGTFPVHRFPIGWRMTALLATRGIPATGKAVAARAVKALP